MTEASDLKEAVLKPGDLLLGGDLVDKDAAPIALFRLAELPRAVFDPRLLAGTASSDGVDVDVDKGRV